MRLALASGPRRRRVRHHPPPKAGVAVAPPGSASSGCGDGPPIGAPDVSSVHVGGIPHTRGLAEGRHPRPRLLDVHPADLI